MSTRKLTREEWFKAIGQWRRSGQTRENYCAGRDLNPRRMVWWERQLAGRSSAAGEAVASTFVEVTQSGEVVAPERLEIEVGGVRVRIPAEFDEQALTRVLAVLEARR